VCVAASFAGISPHAELAGAGGIHGFVAKRRGPYRRMFVLAVAAAAAFHAPLRPHASVTAAPRLATVRPVTVPPRLATVRRHGLSPVAIAPEANCIDEPSSFACPIDEPPLPENEDWLQPALPVLALCCAIAAICALDRVVMSVAILPMTEQYGYTDVQKGQIASAFSVGYCISQLPSGTLAALTSPKSVLLGGLVVWSAAQAASPAAAAAGLPVLLGMRAVMGAGEAAAVPSLQAVAAKFVPAKRRSLFWGVLSASLSCGTIASYLVAPPLIAEYGWEFVFVAFGACGVVLAALWAVLGASEPALALGTATAAPVAAATTTAPATAPAAPAKKPKLSDVPWGDVVRSRPVWALTVSHASHNFFMYFGFSWLPTYFNYQFGMDTAAASSASLLPFIAGGIGSLSAGAACDLLQSELGVTRTNARKILQSIACAGPAVAMLILAALGEGLVPGVELTRDAAEAHLQPYMHMHMHVHVHVHVHVHTHMHTHMHMHMCMCMCMSHAHVVACICTCACTCAYAHTCTCACACRCSCACACACTCTCACACASACAKGYMCWRMRHHPSEAAIVCIRGCESVHSRRQKLCAHRACHPMH
jgi:ACS family sodium-dependent inorganic phosphate cotransporter